MPPPIPDDKMAALTDALLAGRKIEAIKLYREQTGRGLKESKDEIEKIETSLRAQFPDKFAARGKGCLGAAAIVAVAGVVFARWVASA